MSDRLTEIAERAHIMANSPVVWDKQTGRDMLALVQIAKAAREVSRIEATGVLPDFMPLAIALNQLEEGEE